MQPIDLATAQWIAPGMEESDGILGALPRHLGSHGRRHTDCIKAEEGGCIQTGHAGLLLELVATQPSVDLMWDRDAGRDVCGHLHLRFDLCLCGSCINHEKEHCCPKACQASGFHRNLHWPFDMRTCYCQLTTIRLVIIFVPGMLSCQSITPVFWT
ncbi:MAG: hypothetical protein OZ917_12705 [Candidatus Brocadiaceae bacterium]|nr:hypothetical protein [Candidatus Brocadiaceae bacterium]